MKHLLTLLAASLAVLLLQSTAPVKPSPEADATLAAAPAIIVHPGSKITTLSKAEIKDIFLGKTTTWKDGTPIVVLNLGDKDIHEAFTKEYTGKTASQYEKFWKKIVFTGKGKMPKSERNEKKMISSISKKAGAIGYVSDATSKDAAQMKGKDGSPLAIAVTVK